MNYDRINAVPSRYQFFSVSNVLSHKCSTFRKRLTEKIARRCGEWYEKTINLIRSKPPFIIFRSALLCIRGSQSYRSLHLLF